MNDNEASKSFPCTDCQAGVMHLKHLTYFTWLDEELVIVPNFPAWLCDVCGRREYDTRAIAWITTLLNPDTGKPAGKSRHPRPPVEKRDSTSPMTK